MVHLSDRDLATRMVAILVANGTSGDSVALMQATLHKVGAITTVIAPGDRHVRTSEGLCLQADLTFDDTTSAVYDAVLIAGGDDVNLSLAHHARAVEFIRCLYRQGKTVVVIGCATTLMQSAGVRTCLANGETDPGLMTSLSNVSDAMLLFIHIAYRHHHPERNTDLSAT